MSAEHTHRGHLNPPQPASVHLHTANSPQWILKDKEASGAPRPHHGPVGNQIKLHDSTLRLLKDNILRLNAFK